MKWCELREYKWNEYVTIAVNRNLSNCEKARKKEFRGFNGIRTRGLCVSAAVLYQPELWRPIHWRPANLLSSSARERNETQNEMMWTAGIQMKWVCDHRSESQFRQLRKSSKKKIIQDYSNVWSFGHRQSTHKAFNTDKACGAVRLIQFVPDFRPFFF